MGCKGSSVAAWRKVEEETFVGYEVIVVGQGVVVGLAVENHIAPLLVNVISSTLARESFGLHVFFN